MNNNVSHPSHYTYGKIECIDFIQDKNLNFCLGNAIKYIVRAGHKASNGMTANEKAIEDLEKAKQYIDFEIKVRQNFETENSQRTDEDFLKNLKKFERFSKAHNEMWELTHNEK